MVKRDAKFVLVLKYTKIQHLYLKEIGLLYLAFRCLTLPVQKDYSFAHGRGEALPCDLSSTNIIFTSQDKVASEVPESSVLPRSVHQKQDRNQSCL